MLVFYSLLVAFLVLYLCVQRKFYWLAWKIRGPIGLPFIGCVELLSPRNVLSFISKMSNSYTSPITGWLGPICFLYIADPENVERVLTAPECINKSAVYDYLSGIFGSGLLTNKNPEWSYHRKLLNPAFKTQTLSQFASVFNAKSKELCEHLKECSQLKEPIDIDDMLQKFTFSISCETIMGQESNIQYGKGNEIVESYNILIEAVSKKICNIFYKSSFITKLMDNEHHIKVQKALLKVNTYMKKCVEATSKQFQNVGIGHVGPTKCSVVSHAVELNRKGLFSTDEVINEINNVMVASYETTSKAILHIITLLAMYPEWQEKLYEELEERFPDKDVELSFENIQDTPLTDMIIKETLRLLPVVLFEGRIKNSEFPLFDDVILPKGTNIVVDIYSMHRNPKYWGADAMQFNPYRFLQDEVAQRHPFVYIPFSKGLRNCIGWRYANLAMKVFVVKVVQRYRFATTMKLDDLDLIFNISGQFTQQPLFTIEDRSIQVGQLAVNQ